jgi:hypothetical protein
VMASRSAYSSSSAATLAFARAMQRVYFRRRLRSRNRQ